METMNVARPLVQPLLPTKATNEASSSSNLSNTKNLSIYGNEDLQCLPDWLKGLPYLEMLQVLECSKFKDLSPCIQDLTLLRMLMIDNCEVFNMSNDDPITWRSLRSLRFLLFNCLPKLSALPQGIQYATSLEYLYILDCKSLASIPEWINNLKSLQILSISACPNLKSLPEGIRDLTSLDVLEIKDCPVLLKAYWSRLA
ncbi:LRR domain containing protein [Trema orientale]|uniref:LRR domain containing protein n=1 Tax=Trema orientale TaxID=63057 RepID=A0A2P5A6H5_TREOI|nr:LRR domain containing protein [Trema orientale]